MVVSSLNVHVYVIKEKMIDPNDPTIINLQTQITNQQNEISTAQSDILNLESILQKLISAFLQHSHTDPDPFIPTTTGGGRYIKENFDAQT